MVVSGFHPFVSARRNLQVSMERSAAKCGAMGIRTRTFECESMVLSRKIGASHPQRRSPIVRSYEKNEIRNTEQLQRVSSAGLMDSFYHLRGAEMLLLHIERSQSMWFGLLVRTPPGPLPRDAIQAGQNGRRA